MERIEATRITQSAENHRWKKWGSYLAERQWGTVREDYSKDGSAWEFISHEKARSNAYRWGEEGIAGFCESFQILCMAPAFWNGNDPILKERLFGLTNGQGNHGEDVKELYYHLAATPTHTYCKYLYKYPQVSFPYKELVDKNQVGRDKDEYELIDTGAFADNKYFDIYIEYAKATTEDILMKVTVYNRAAEAADIHVLPHVWFRNYWKHNQRFKDTPFIETLTENSMKSSCERNGYYHIYHEEGEQLFCENETNDAKIYGGENTIPYVKDGINDYVIDGENTVNPDKKGSKSAVWYKRNIPAGDFATFKIRVSRHERGHPFDDFDSIFEDRIEDYNKYYDEILPPNISEEKRQLLEKAFGGLLWTKQFYYYDVYKWRNGGLAEIPPYRETNRNASWSHLANRDVISMPDKWEYPWYAAWDLAFHMITFAEVDIDFAKEQLMLMLREDYMHPNGQIPAYEWNFSDVNPPVHSYAVWNVYEKEKEKTGKGDTNFLRMAYQKLLINFTWWVNQKDKNGTDLFDGGFLGLDNIGVFDRSHMPEGIARMQQADATSWMAMFTLNMLRMSLELSIENKAYEESAAKFFKHFLNIGWAMHNIGKKGLSLWDNNDNFYYDVVEMENGQTERLRVRSLVGIIPLFATEVINKSLSNDLHEFKKRVRKIIRSRPDLASLISDIEINNDKGDYLVAIMRGFRLEHVLKRLLDEDEFLSDYGIRSLSKYHEKNPFVFDHHGRHRIQYEAGESQTNMFGGNSNWRGPIWFPLNYMIIASLRKYYKYYGPEYVYEFPTGSGNKINLKEIADELTRRLGRLFERNEDGKYQYHTDNVYASEDAFKEQHLFYEFFDGDNGRGLGASHQTGWTALIANLLMDLEK